MSQPNTGEPTHEDGDKERPGSQPLTDTVTTSLVANANAAWAEHFDNNQQRNRLSAQNPHLTDPYSPLETLMGDAYERFGNMSIETMSGTVKRVLQKFANRIVEDFRVHPYTYAPDLDYYVSLQDIRPIPDEIMIAGLTFHYAKWQASAKAQMFFTEYYATLNQILYQRKFGSGKVQLAAVDRPSITSATMAPITNEDGTP